jgi:HK97 family phage major capsid protein
MTRSNVLASAAGVMAMAQTSPEVFGRKDDVPGSEDAGVLDLIKGIKTSVSDMEKTRDQFNETVAKLQKDSGDNSKAFDEFKSATDVRLTEYNGQMTTLGAKLDELVQKVARPNGGDGDPAAKSFGQRVVEHEDLKDYSGGRVAFKLNHVAGMKSITSAPASAGPLIDPQRLPGFITSPDRRMTIRGLIAPGQTTSNAIEFVREKTFTNNADMVAEGAQKPESDITFELDSAKVAKIAHWIHASSEAMDDATGLASQIDTRLRYGLNYKEELQLLKGDGVGQNLKGLMTMARAFASPVAVGTITDASNIDVLRIAALVATIDEYMASGYVLNHIDWAMIELTKDREGRYILANPQGVVGPNMWGVPVVPTNVMDPDNFLTGAFDQAVQIFDRKDTEVVVSDEDRDNFINNMLTVLAEKRLALVGYREDALIQGTFSAARGAL